MTTFQSRELVRDELVALFVANGSWQDVFNGFPGVAEISGKTPVLIIRSRGTRQRFEGMSTNPASYRFLISSWVLAYSASDNWTSADAENKLDELDTTVRQVIRDNVNLTNANNVRFDEGYSEVDDVIIEGVPYILETRIVYADLPRGAT